MNFTIEEIQNSCLKLGFSVSAIQLIIEKLPLKRSGLENKSLHVLFLNISQELNEMGLEFTYRGLKGIEINTTFTPEIVKNFIWRPLQKVLLDKESTTELTHNDISLIFEILGKWFSEKGIVIEFPSIESLMNKSKNNEKSKRETEKEKRAP